MHPSSALQPCCTLRLGLTFTALLAAAPAQPVALPATLTPLTNELPHQYGLPFMVANCRLQVLYDEAELGGATTLLVNRIALRYDGPSGAAVRAHRIDRLSARLGSSRVSSASAGSEFAANRTQPLTTVWSGPFDYLTDGSVVRGPEAFGGAQGALALPLAQPLAFAVPPGGALVFELDSEGNDNAGDAAWLDACIDPSNRLGAGFDEKNGRGCPVGLLATSPALDVTGTFEPGGALHVSGAGFAPNAPVAVAFTSSVLASPLAFPSTNPICWAYIDVGTTLSTMLSASGNDGRFRGEPLPVPKRPASAGAVLYVQAVTPVAPFTGNSFGLASSNYRTIHIGILRTPGVGAWTAAHAGDASAAVASNAFYGGLALLLQ
jgi:hypothetical protein